VSYFERRLGFPVSLRRRAALRFRRTGGYDSRQMGKDIIVRAPSGIARTQNTHLHPFAAARKPPATGPTTWSSKSVYLFEYKDCIR
jgi:hypothetical protein